MRTVKYMAAASGLSTLFLCLVIANAVLAPMPEKAPSSGGWTTTVIKTTY